MAEGSATLKGLRAQMVAAAQAQAEERRSLAGNSPGPTANTQAKPQGCRPVIDGAALRIDDRLRVAKERREEAERQQALRDSQIMERERKAKMQVERQLEERQKKVVEQRKKEEQKRIAVEEKRKQKQEEEKEHYEAVMRRTLERSQRVEQRQKRWSWGGLSTDSDGRGGDSDASASSPVAIVISPASPDKPLRSRQVDKRSTSTMNLKQPSEANISKRLSSSSATLIKSPDKSFKSRSSSCNRLPSNGKAAQATKEDDKKLQVEQTGHSLKKRSSSLTRVSVGKAQTPAKTDKGTTDDQARRPPVSTVDGGLLSRLLTPTQASIARSKSAAALSAEGTDAPASASPLHPPRGPVRSRSIDRQQKTGMTTSVSADGALSASLSKQDKQVSSPGRQRPPSPSIPSTRNRSPSPAPNPAPKRTPSPNTAKQSSKTRPPSPGAAKQRPPSPQTASAKTPPIPKPALTPTGPLRKRDSKSKEMFSTPPSALTSSESSKSKEKDDSKSSVGTNSASEAAKMLAENRRLMREQKEKEEQLRLQREEEEKARKEEEKRLAEEARLKRLEEEKKLEEERKLKEEEDARKAEEERVRLAEEEALKQAELQKEREEAEAKALEEAERIRQERDRIMQQNQQERMERKKRIEEIMKRTRKGDQGDSKRDDDKLQDDEEDEDDAVDDDVVDPVNSEPKVVDEEHTGDTITEDNKDEFPLASGEPVEEREEPLGSVNGKPESDDKENNNGVQHGDSQADSPVPMGRLVEGSDFLNEQDPANVVSGLNGKSNQWNIEELIEHNVHSKSRPLIETDDCNQVLIDCDAPDGTTMAFEEKDAPVSTLHSANQPIEAMPEI
ncbi:ensconsin isoform X2 [Synchiropus splendidus]|uniref:ensconsin isoform X2 n=1 Tax=Synchiropus splendidus TaxID=270530 RepID=UPI00237EE2CE|nr:ensconsin isoform X2 [Synchiropus splendidus]